MGWGLMSGWRKLVSAAVVVGECEEFLLAADYADMHVVKLLGRSD